MITSNFFLSFKRPHIGTVELAHLEMIGAMIYQLTKGATIEEMKQAERRQRCLT